MRTLPPFLKILPPVIVGILLGRWIDVEWWIAAIASFVCLFCALLWHKRNIGQVYALCSLLFCALTTTLMRVPVTATAYSTIHTTQLTTTSLPELRGNSYQTDAKVVINGRQRLVRLFTPTSLPLEVGTMATATGRIIPLPEGNYGSLLARRGYYATLRIDNPSDLLTEGSTSSITIAARRVQSRLLGHIDSLHLPARESGVVKAMLLGWRGGIETSLREDYARAGASHLLAISGLHVGFVALLVWWLLWLLPAAGRRGHIVRNIVAIVVMAGYAFITGLSPSVVRATLMFCTAQLAFASGRPGISTNTFCAAITLMLLLNPNNLYDISFLLSATAVAGILIGYQPIYSFFVSDHTPRAIGWLVGLFVVGFCATAATLPIVSHTFGTVSIVGLVLNPVVVLCAELIVLCGIIWVSLPLGWLSPVAKWLIGGAASLQNRVVEKAAEAEWAAIDVGLPLWVVLLSYALIVAALVTAAALNNSKRYAKR